MKLKDNYDKTLKEDYAQICIVNPKDRAKDIIFYVRVDKFDELTKLLQYCKFHNIKI